MQWYEDEVRALEDRLGKLGNLNRDRLQSSPFPSDPVVFYGSSTITMWSTLASDLDLPNALNLGFGGSTLEACAYFFERLVVPVQPASLVVYAGDNDLGDGHTPENVLKSFQALADKVDRYFPCIPFGFVSVKPSPARFNVIDRIRRANDLIRRDIERRENGFFISVFEAMLDDRGNPRPELFLADGLHLGPEGYRLLISLLAGYRNQIFNPHSTECNPAQLQSRQVATRVSQVVQPSSQP
jgi:lysophospholipase L1-like esterase